jgi:hypothetical protein
VTATLARNSFTALSDIRVNSHSLLITPLSATVTRNENEHDTASIFVVSGSRDTDFSLLPDQRIEFDYGSLGGRRTFQGYVNSVTPQKRAVGNQIDSSQEIFCYGASMALKGNRPRFFTALTLTQMMARIVSDANLGFNDEYHNDTLVWRTLAQTSETDWEMLLSLSGRLGARILYDQGVIRLINYQDIGYRQLPTKSLLSVPIDADLSAAETGSPGAGAVLEFMPTNTTTAQDPALRTPTMAFLAGQSAVVMTPPLAALMSRPSAPESTGGPTLVSGFATTMPALSYQEAEQIQAGFYDPSWPQQASVRIMGDATTAPGTTVQISSAGQGETVTPAYDGVWYVSGVEHQMGIGHSFYTVLTLGRQVTRGKNWYQYRPFWLGDRRGAPVLRPSGTGQWISNWR